MNTPADPIPDTELSKLAQYRESHRLPYDCVDRGDLIAIAERELFDSPYVTRLLEKALEGRPNGLPFRVIWHLLQKLDRSKQVDCLKVLVYLATMGGGNNYWWYGANQLLPEVVDLIKPQDWQSCIEFTLEDDDLADSITWENAIYLSQQLFPSFAQTLVLACFG
ncbi:MAG: hypothetical protein JSS49_28020 [Planctomycetes bacterium]|nr:hypothetical protein [Planctomycetota bacterium]